jgi:hypothetical protein
LLQAIKQTGGDEGHGDLAEALDAVVTSTSGSVRELARLAALFESLGRLGPEERTTATRLLASFVAYAQQAAPQP